MLLPNVEFVFGLAGSTASVLISFILPAAIFLKQSDVVGGSQGNAINLIRGSKQWHRQRRMATALLVFGLLAAVACTGALVASIQEEAEVAELAHALVKEDKKAMAAVEVQERAAQAATAVGAAAEAQRHLNASVHGVGQVAAASERASKTASGIGTGGGKTTEQKEVTKRVVKSDLVPAVVAVKILVASLERAAEVLDMAIEVAEAQQAQAVTRTGGSLATAAADAADSLANARQARRAVQDLQRALMSGSQERSAEEGERLIALLKDVTAKAQAAASTLAAVQAAQSDRLQGLVAQLKDAHAAANATVAAAGGGAGEEQPEGVGNGAEAVQEEGHVDASGTATVDTRTIDKPRDGAVGTAGNSPVSSGRVDVVELLKEAEIAAAGTKAAAKTKAVQAVETTRSEVAVRSIEIAKELRALEEQKSAGGGQTKGALATNSSGTVGVEHSGAASNGTALDGSSMGNSPGSKSGILDDLSEVAVKTEGGKGASKGLAGAALLPLPPPSERVAGKGSRKLEPFKHDDPEAG